MTRNSICNAPEVGLPVPKLLGVQLSEILPKLENGCWKLYYMSRELKHVWLQGAVIDFSQHTGQVTICDGTVSIDMDASVVSLECPYALKAFENNLLISVICRIWADEEISSDEGTEINIKLAVQAVYSQPHSDPNAEATWLLQVMECYLLDRQEALVAEK